MLRKEVILRTCTLRKVFHSLYSSSASSQINIEKLEAESGTVDVLDESDKFKEEQLELKRNKSRLRNADRKLLFDQNPYPEPCFWHHGTLKYNRKMYGRYGEQSGVDPAICWPTDEELKRAQEYERIAFPFTISEMVKEAEDKRALLNAQQKERQKIMLEKVAKLGDWKRELEMKIAKKEAEANAAREKRERLIEEVRKHFGYKVDPKDEKFKELLEKKEKEQKKLAKEARKKEKEAKMLERLKSKKKEKKEEEKPEDDTTNINETFEK